jgi:GNAT superfamily N-acetyltransferase
MEIAYQAARTVPWTTQACSTMAELRRDIDSLDNWGYYLDYLQSQLGEVQEEARSAALLVNFNDISHEPLFSLKTMSLLQPALYDGYICKLNDLITYLSKYQDGSASDLALAVQAVKIGRASCSLATTLLKIANETALARKMAIVTACFSFHILIQPVLETKTPICQVLIRPSDRKEVWDFLKTRRGYSDAEVERLDNYTIVSLNYPLAEQSTRIAFVITNHDVTHPFFKPSDTTPADFQYPIVVIQHVDVSSDFRGQSNGTLLVRHIKRWARKNNYEAIAVYEDPLMLKTEGFWTAMGFRKSQTVHGWREIEFKE